MTTVLICSEERLDEVLDETVLWREGVERHKAMSLEVALSLAREHTPRLVAVHREFPDAVELVRSLRRGPDTRNISLVVVAPEDFHPLDVELLEVGANAILRLPPTAEWDVRLMRLMSVPARKDVRFPVEFEILTQSGGSVESVSVTALNLSVSGMLIESSQALRVGEDLDFHFHISEEQPAIRGCARVVRLGGRHRYGIEFYGLEGDGTSRIQDYVDDLSNSATLPVS